MDLLMQSSCWLCLQLGPPKVIEIFNVSSISSFSWLCSPAQPYCISCSHQDLHLLFTLRCSSFVYIKTLISCSHQDLHLLLTPRASSLAHTKTFLSCSHQEHCELDTQSQTRLNPIPTTVSMGLHPPALLLWP